MLYSQYANPKELIRMYIKRGRFGEFVTNILRQEEKRKKEEAEKDNERKLWMIYVHSMSGKSFNEWKRENVKPVNKSGGDLDMTVQDQEEIMNKLFSNR